MKKEQLKEVKALSMLLPITLVDKVYSKIISGEKILSNLSDEYDKGCAQVPKFQQNYPSFADYKRYAFKQMGLDEKDFRSYQNYVQKISVKEPLNNESMIFSMLKFKNKSGIVDYVSSNFLLSIIKSEDKNEKNRMLNVYHSLNTIDKKQHALLGKTLSEIEERAKKNNIKLFLNEEDNK